MPEKYASAVPGSVSQRIHRAFSELSEGERRIADQVLAAPGELAFLSASELAGQAGVSNATVSRFFQRLGYRNFDAARQEARRLRETGSPLYLSGGAGQGTPAGDPLSALLQEEAARLEATLRGVPQPLLAEIAQAIAGAGQIRTLGFRNSHFLAQYLTAQLAQIRPGVAPLLMPGQTRAEAIAGLGAQDLAIVIGLRRRPADFLRTVEQIAAQRVPVLLVSDPTVRGAPALARWTLSCHVDTVQFLDSYAAPMTLLRMITLEVARELGAAGRAHLDRVEALRGDLNELE